eukprot:CAMPEP_0168330636 /NCGR_PEP_ID=MMETSP0213-20121227/7857_1 /TAXON_ID=151035 /ORGANISM="Euplotes harpa, Strain FSP1.4" /LENGTH=123 /DNA_ID=CAMNT_0008334261 /DNA_START=30 /DNA_END=398 /DNA_ORIENTATION=+
MARKNITSFDQFWEIEASLCEFDEDFTDERSASGRAAPLAARVDCSFVKSPSDPLKNKGRLFQSDKAALLRLMRDSSLAKRCEDLGNKFFPIVEMRSKDFTQFADSSVFSNANVTKESKSIEW